MIFLEFHDVGLQGDIVREIVLGSAQQAQGFIVALLSVGIVGHILEAEYGFGVPLFGGKFVGGFGAIEELGVVCEVPEEDGGVAKIGLDLREIVDFSNLSWGNYFYIAAMGYKWRDGRIVNVPLSFGRIVIAGDTAFGEIEKIPENDVYLDKEDAIKDKLGNIEVVEFPESQVKYEIKITISEDGNPKTSKLLKQ